jgi:nucleotide-binding universal stress UspA family protein
MFKKIAVVFDESLAASRALASAISLAKTLDADLKTVTVVELPPVYTGYVLAVPMLSQVLSKDRIQFYEDLQKAATAEGKKHVIAISTHLVVGDEVEAIVDFLRQEKMDLLVIGLHRNTPRVARLWSTVFELEQEAPCSVLGIH